MIASKKLLAVLILTSLASLGGSCASTQTGGASTDEMFAVWTKDGDPPRDLPTPEGFRLSPKEAFDVVAMRKRLSLQHTWFCFRHHEFYYIADGVDYARNADNALMHGVQVNGLTGAIN